MLKVIIKKYTRTIVLSFVILCVGFILGNTTTRAITISNKGPIGKDRIDFQNVFADLVAKTSPAVVNISASFVEESGGAGGIPKELAEDPMFQQFFRNLQRSPQRRQVTSLGSGFIIDPNGYIVTNNHVVAKTSKDIKIIMQDGRELNAEVYARDEKTDIAILKVNATNLPTITFGDSDSMRVGDWVIAIGNPFGLGGSVTQGIISGRGRNINLGAYDDFIQTDASVNQGNSGGPMINLRGEVIGIYTAIFSPNGGSVGISFAVPSSTAVPIIKQLIDNKKVTRGWIGITLQPIDESIAKILDIPAQGVLVYGVLDNSPSSKAGLLVGDIITKFNDRPITGNNSFPSMVASTTPGTTVKLTVLRGGQQMVIDLVLETYPDNIDLSKKTITKKRTNIDNSKIKTVQIKDFGVKIAQITPEIANAFNLPESTNGILVLSVADGSAAAALGFVGGIAIETINLQPATIESFESMVKAKKPVLLLISIGQDRRFITTPTTLEEDK